jgi:hypothetical protein
VIAAALLAAGSAPAAKSRLFVTGFDPDYHCVVGLVAKAKQRRGGLVDPEACDFFKHAVPFVRKGAPHPHKPVLVLDRTTDNSPIGGHELVKSLKKEFGNDFPMVVINPRGQRFANARIKTRRFSALIVASDTRCGGCDLNENGDTATPDSNAIADRKRAIRRFFRHGGGILALSSGATPKGGTLNHCEAYYAFSPIHIPCGGADHSGTSTVTPAGERLGFTSENFGSAHNAYGEPGPNSPLRVAARLTASPFSPTALFAKVRFR